MRPLKRVPALFFRTAAGGEPVREWLKSLRPEDRRAIGFALEKAEYGWPVGMPLARALGDSLHELRVDLSTKRTARVFFFISKSGNMILLHGIIKKTQRTPDAALVLARRNMATFKRNS